MRYKLLNNNIGIIISRKPETFLDNVIIEFVEAPESATAILTNQYGEKSYLKLQEGKCTFARKNFQGSIKVALAVFNGSVHAPKWICEGFYIEPLENGMVIVYPDDADIQGKIGKLQEAVSTIETAICELTLKINELEKRLDKMLEGYDII